MSRPAKKARKAAPVQQSGDALEDDFAIEEAFVASGSDEGDDEAGQAAQGGHDAVPLEDETAFLSDHDTPPQKKKRKLDQPKKDDKNTKDKPKKQKVKKDDVKKDAQAEPRKPVELDTSISTLPPELLADRIAEKQKRALSKMTDLELADLRLPAKVLYDASHISERTHLAQFVKDALPALPATLSKPLKANGAPRVIVLSGAALRVADLCRDVKEWKTKESDVAKLFAKHFKLQQHVEYLQKTKVAIAVGTPGRIAQLLNNDDDPLQLTYLSYIILDVSALDAKKRALWDLNDSREDLFKNVLGHKKVLERLKQDKAKIVVF